MLASTEVQVVVSACARTGPVACASWKPKSLSGGFGRCEGGPKWVPPNGFLRVAHHNPGHLSFLLQLRSSSLPNCSGGSQWIHGVWVPAKGPESDGGDEKGKETRSWSACSRRPSAAGANCTCQLVGSDGSPSKMQILNDSHTRQFPFCLGSLGFVGFKVMVSVTCSVICVRLPTPSFLSFPVSATLSPTWRLRPTV